MKYFFNNGSFSIGLSLLLGVVLCLSACSSSAPSDEVVTKAAKIVMGQSVSSVEILKRLKPYEDSFTSPGDKTTAFPVRAKVILQDGVSQEVELKIFRRHTDDEWYVYRMGLGGVKIS
jgi:hypothetical protein